ncbi:MAG: succinate dehydrogenase, cytochrome b556 subunit [Pelagibacteraceae bacterium]|nr:succinate dehydrogenase, cytochrome b556 subunit [Pelagibacteraceae bacterium]|tara:strand:- start:5022 stop:5390 length:369 start_codon:yes stop_codon:yes gene_type:complete
MNQERPLSPHLSIHKKILTSVFSIFHRVTGIGLSFGSILIAIWILLLALGPNYFYFFQNISSIFVFKLILFFWTLAIFYHLFNGIRYLFWSFGKGMALDTVYLSGYIVLVSSITATIFVWIL